MWFLKKLFKKRDEQLSEDGDVVKPFLDHLEDLRWTLLKMLATLTVAMLLAFSLRKQIAAALAHPLVIALGTGAESTLISINPLESVTMSFVLAFYAGIVVSFPILFYFLAEFLLPALTKKEKRYVLPAVVVGFGLFLCGVLLCYFYVLPPTLRWLHSDVSGFNVKPSWTMREYYGFVTHLCIAVGLVCELPVVMVTLSGIGLISYAWLKGMRMYGYAIALVLAGIISPTPDLFMLFVFALPIMVLFEACIWIVWLLEKRRARHEAAVEQEERRTAPPPPPPDENREYHDHDYHDEYHDPHHGYDDFHDHDGHGDPHHGDDPHAPPAKPKESDTPKPENKPSDPPKPASTPESGAPGQSAEPDKTSGPEKPAS